MGATALGQHARAPFSAGVSVVAADLVERAQLRRSSSALSHHPDSVYLVSRPANRREGLCDLVREYRGLLMLLAGRALRNSLPPGLAAGDSRLFGAVPLSHEHDQGAAVRDYLSRSRNLLPVREKVLAARAAGLRLHAHLRHVRVVDNWDSHLDDRNWVD